MKKKEKYFLFSDNMTIYTENPQDVQYHEITKSNKWIQQCYKYKINAKEKSHIFFLHTSNAYVETKFKTQHHLKLLQRKGELEITTKHVQALYARKTYNTDKENQRAK